MIFKKIKMKLSRWAKNKGLTYQTAWNLFKSGNLKGYQLPTGTIIIEDERNNSNNLKQEEKIIIYCRVSSSQNKSNLESQAERLINYCNAKGWNVYKVYKEIGSGLNDNRKLLTEILKNKEITKIVVEHKDKFARFGISFIKVLLENQNRELHIVNEAFNDKEDLIQDLVSIITSFCSRIYGLRKSKRKTEKIINELYEVQ